LFQPQRSSNFSRANALWGETHQQMKDRQAVWVAKRGESMSCANLFHIS
jgi:hypothetical protein